MKILVGYFSETGNTKRVAEAIGEEAKAAGHDVHIKAAGEITASQLDEYAVVFLGSTCHSADVAAPLKSILDGIPEGSKLKLAGFVTHSTTMPEDGEMQKDMYERWAGRCPVTFETVSKEKGIDFIGFFHCQGAPSPQIEDFIRNNVPDVAQWDGYFEDVRKHPTLQDIEAAKKFAKDTLTKC